MCAPRPTLLVIQHVPWETPHRILDACGALETRTVEPLAGDPLPDPAQMSGAIVMGGPMGADDVALHSALATETEWLARAAGVGMPILGICLGAQLLARALGAGTRPGQRAEIGFAPVEVHDPSDPLIGALAPRTTVLHWHSDVFDLPTGAQPLASSALSEHQAFRLGNAWGLLFHPEADATLLDAWLSVPEMAAEATHVLGPTAAALPHQARAAEPTLIGRSTPGFDHFAHLVATFQAP
jgi:GMP synthase (glutamine-hydrolysing)